MMNSLEAARAKGRGKPWRSQGFVAELLLPDDERVTIEQTTRDSSHFTVWCDDKDLLLSCVTRVVPILEDPDNV